MGKPKRSVREGDVAISNQELVGRERDRRLGVFIVEVARATHEGRLPVSQTEILRALKRNFRLDLVPSGGHALTNILRHKFRNKIWLHVDKQQVTLFSEDETLVDSRAIRALLLAREHRNDDGLIAMLDWKERCLSDLNLSSEICDEFVDDFVKSRYVEGPDSKGFLKLDVRAIGEDEFYLRQAAKAGIKKSIARTRPART